MGEKLVTGKRRKYDAAFEEVLNMVYKGPLVSDMAQALGIGENLIYKWESRAVGREKPPVAVKVVDLVQEKVLHKRIWELEIERDILKKALAIFSRQT